MSEFFIGRFIRSRSKVYYYGWSSTSNLIKCDFQPKTQLEIWQIKGLNGDEL